MADKDTLVAAGNTPEQVALELLKMIALAERKAINYGKDAPEGWELPDREYILTTYGACVSTVRDGFFSKPG